MYRFPTEKSTVDITRACINQQFSDIKQIRNQNHRLILLCSLIDSFAQHNANYHPRKNAEQFAEFILKYSSKEQKELLSMVCPSTIYYHSQAHLPKDYSLGLNKDTPILCADDPSAINETNRILELLPESILSKRQKQHRYAQLIYAMRNKLTHELTVVGSEVSFFTPDSDPIPHMVYGVAGYPECWLLHIPEKLIWEVAQSSISNYLNECAKEGTNPFYRNSIERICYKTWYEE